MKKSTKIVCIVCLILAVLVAGLAILASAESGKIAEVEARAAEIKKAQGTLKSIEMGILDIDPATIVVPEPLEMTAFDQFLSSVNASARMLWVVVIDLLIIGAGGFIMAAARKAKSKKQQVKNVGSSNNVIGILIALAALCLDLAIASPVFLTSSNFLNVSQQISINFVVAVGMTLVIISGGIDLSVGSNIALTGLLMGIMMKNYSIPVLPTIIICILFSGFIGLVNGWLISFLNLPPFIATLGTMSIVRGFAERCAKQLETLAQGLVTSDDLRACAEEETGADRLRLLDLAAVMDAVNARMQDRYQDGDTELIAAAARAESAAFIEGACFFFYGFDMMPHTLIQLVGRIAARADAQLFFPLKNDAEARDYLCYQGAEQALGRIFAQCGGTRVRINAQDARPADVSALTDEIYAVRKRAFRGAPRHVRALMAQDVRQECMQAAATARRKPGMV